ncbi:hypothetical protein J437_LFUL015753, partial [Ladona fulva]
MTTICVALTTMSTETPGFLSDIDAYMSQRSPGTGNTSFSKADIKAAESSLKRKIADSFEGQFKERKRSPSPLRIGEWEYTKMREDIANYKSEIVQLESRLRKQAEMRVESEIAAAKTIKRLELEMGMERAEAKQLRYLVERLRQNLAEQTEQTSESIKAAEAEKAKAETKVNKAELEVLKVKDMLREVETNKESLLQQLSSLKVEVGKVTEELKEEKLKVAKMECAVRTKARDALYLQKDLEKRAINAERLVQELTHERDFLSESLKEARSTATWVLKEAELENELMKAKSEIKMLREAVQNKMMLEENNNGLQERVKSLESLLKNSAELEAAKSELLQKLNEWQSFATKICEAAGLVNERDEGGNEGGVSLTTARKAVSRMQFKETELTADLLEAQSRLKEFQTSQSHLSSGSENLKLQIDALTKEKSELVSVVHMTRKKLQLVSQERDTYRQILDSMEQDMTMSGAIFHSASSSKSPQKNTGSIGKGSSKVEELERLVEKYQKNVAEEAAAAAVLGKYSEEEVISKVKDAVDEARKRLEKEIEVLWNDKENALKEVNHLRERIDQLEGEIEHRALKGDFNMVGTKILHFNMNPLTLATEKYVDDLQTYRAECERLRERVKVLEENNALLLAKRQSGEVSGNLPSGGDDDLLGSEVFEVTKVVEQRLQVQGSKEVQ